MSRNQRNLGLIAAVVVIAVVAFIIAKPGGDDDKAAGSQASDTSQSGGGTSGGSKPAAPKVTRIAIKGDGVQGGVKTIEVKKGDPVRIVVTVDKLHHLHLHGWDVEKDATPGKPAKFNVTAKNEGEFELESHTFEDAGLEAGLAKIRVEPS
jgi:heme/copper-type cytochrome/quinol oxidase subunit 2